MKLHYFGHSSFALTTNAGTKIVTDPYGEVGFVMPRVSADAVTVSHGHYDHCNVKAVNAPAVFDRAGEYALKDVRIEAVESFHDDAGGRKRGGNLIFRFFADGLCVCHLGDLGEPLSAKRIASIAPADVLLLPVGGNYTIDAAEAAKYVGAISPAVAIPMHFYTKGLTVDIDGPEAFLRRFGKSSVIRVGNEIEIDRASLPQETKIVFMERTSY